MFGYDNLKSIVVMLDYDPAADDDVVIWRAPEACEIVSAHAWTPNNVAASTANYFDIALYNGGAIGTATTALAGTVGGTAGWTGNTPVAFTVSEGTLASGDTVMLRYNEEGTGTFAALAVQLNYRSGVAA